MRGLAVTYEPHVLRGAREGTMLAGSTGNVHARAAQAAWVAATDVLAVLAIVFAIPFVILAVGVPIALGVQLLLWIGRLL